MLKRVVTMDVGSDGVAIITISNPPVNALHPRKLVEAMWRDDVIAVVLTGTDGQFSAGFDINVFEKVHKTGDSSILPSTSIELTCMIEDAKKPFVAAIEGLALGGGLEVAMMCHARIVTHSAQLGLPELTLGVFPGSGGTQRLPRLIGLQKAVNAMMSSKSFASEEGMKLGLVDAIVPSVDLLKVSRQWALDIAGSRKPWIRSLHKIDKLGSLSEMHEIIQKSRQQAKQTFKNMPHYQACLDVIEEGLLHGGYHGILKESKVFKELVLSDTSRGLVHAFFARRTTSKVPNISDIGLKPRRVGKVAVIGGGLMGSGIATALIVNGVYVILKEINPDYLKRGIDAVEANIKSLVSRKSLSPEKAREALLMLKGALDYSGFKDVDMVIEAVIENIPLKQRIFSELEKVCPPHCILASNTSTIDLNIIGEKTTSPDRIVGAHFFSPAHLMPLLEIVRTKRTSPQVVLDLMTVGKLIKKVPVVVGNCAGFAVNRAFFPYSQSAHLLVNLGVDVFRIDRVISDFGLPMGPFQLQDLAGYEVDIAVRKVFSSAFRGRTFESPLVDLLVKNGRNGKKNGKGYYIYQKGVKPKPDLSILPIVEEARRRTNIMPNGKPISITDEEIIEMILFPVVNEACRVLEEDVVIRASDLDIASILGMSFPSYRGGIVFWADSVGADRVYRSLEKWCELYGTGFFKPSNFLKERAATGLPLSAPSSSSSSRAKPRL